MLENLNLPPAVRQYIYIAMVFVFTGLLVYQVVVGRITLTFENVSYVLGVLSSALAANNVNR